MQKLNPLAVIEQHEVKVIPRHFKQCVIAEHSYSVKKWIEDNIQGRFYLGLRPGADKVSIAGFEREKDLTYFILSCPYIKGE